jgi:hypothetical protein
MLATESSAAVLNKINGYQTPRETPSSVVIAAIQNTVSSWKKIYHLALFMGCSIRRKVVRKSGHSKRSTLRFGSWCSKL